MRPVKIRSLALPAALATLALGLAACASSDPESGSGQDETAAQTPAQVLLSSYDNLRGDSYTMETSMTIDGVPFMEATNQVDGQAARISQELYMSAMLEIAGEEALGDPEAAGLMEAMLSDMHTETILFDGAVYLQVSGGMLGAMTEQLGEDVWFTLDLAEQADLSELYSQIGGFDLASQTETLLNDLTDLEETGDGVYTGTLTTDSELMEQMLGSTGGVAPADAVAMEAIEVVLTVDGDSLLKSIEMTLPDVEGLTMHVVSEIVEVGGDYNITAPDSDNILPFDEFLGAMQ